MNRIEDATNVTISSVVLDLGCPCHKTPLPKLIGDLLSQYTERIRSSFTLDLSGAA